MSLLAATSVAVALPLGLIAMVTALLQGKLLFGRTWILRRAPAGPAAQRRTAEPVTLQRPGGVRLQGWLSVTDGAAPRRVLLWFGGRNEHVGWTPDFGGWLPDDCALLAFNYRSLGGSGGWPSERACVADAAAIAGWARERFGESAPLHLAGRSIGSGIAMQLAARLTAQGRPVESLTLVTPPQSLRAVLAESWWLVPLLPLLRSPLDSLAAASGLRCPVLMLLAESDRQVPHAHSMALATALRAAGCAVQVHQLDGTTHRNLVRTTAAMGLIGRWLTAQ